MIKIQFLPDWRKRRLIKKISDDMIAASNKMLKLVDAEKFPILRLCLVTGAAAGLHEGIHRIKLISSAPLLRIEFKNRCLEYWKGSGFKTSRSISIHVYGRIPEKIIVDEIIEAIKDS